MDRWARQDKNKEGSGGKEEVEPLIQYQIYWILAPKGTTLRYSLNFQEGIENIQEIQFANRLPIVVQHVHSVDFSWDELKDNEVERILELDYNVSEK